MRWAASCAGVLSQRSDKQLFTLDGVNKQLGEL